MLRVPTMYRPVLVVAVLLTTFSLAWVSYGQSTGVVRGEVTDANGGVPGAKVTIRSQNRPIQTFETETDDEGRYRMMGLRANSYEVTANKDGAEAAAVFSIREGQNLQVNLDLAASAAAATAALSEEDMEKVERIEDLKVAFEQGVAASNAGNYQDAITQFQAAIAIVDTCFDCYHNIGIAHEALDQYEEAEVAFLKAVELKPDYAASYTGLAGIYNTQRRFDEATKMSAEAARLSGAGGMAATDPIAFYNQGVIHWNAGNSAEARVQFQLTIELDPTHAEAHYFLAMATLNEGDMADAATALEKYLELAPDGQYADQARAMVPQLKQ